MCISPSRVSHRWRRVALDSPRLWSNIVVATHVGEGIIELLLSRVQDVPLVVDMKDYDEKVEWIWVLAHGKKVDSLEDRYNLALTHLPHMRQLHISSDALRQYSYNLRDHPPVGAPYLSTLVLHLDGGEQRFIVPFFRGAFLARSNLKCHCSSITQALPLLRSGLTYLKVKLDHKSPSDPMEFLSPFLSALKEMHMLEVLRLSSIFPDTLLEELRGQHQEAIILPRLKRLSLEESTETLSWLLTLLHIPSSARTSIWCSHRNTDNSPSVLSTFGNSLSSFLLRSAPPTFSFCSVAIYNDHYDRIVRLGTQAPTDPLLRSVQNQKNGHPEGTLEIKMSTFHMQPEYINYIWSDVPLQNIDTVQVERVPLHAANGSSNDVLLPLAVLVSGMRSVKSLSIIGWPSSLVQDLLTIKVNSPDGSLSFIFPELKHLRLYHQPAKTRGISEHHPVVSFPLISFEMRYTRRAAIPVPPPRPGEVAESLQHMMKVVQDERGSLASVELANYGLSQEDVLDLDFGSAKVIVV